MSVTAIDGMPEAQEFKQPPGLKFLFMTEMWERFSYFGIQALIILFLTEKLGFTEAHASLTYGAYVAFVFLSPLLGGALADRFLGFHHTIVVGAVLIIIGHFVLAIPYGTTPMFIGLAIVVLGTGYFKSSVAAIVGQLYSKEDPRRDSGFTLFYMGINIGALLATLIVGYIGAKISWHLGFSLAGIGMMLGLAIFRYGKRYYKPESLVCPKPHLIAPVVALSLLTIPIVAFLLATPHNAKMFMLIGGSLTYSYVFYKACTSEGKYRRHLISILIYVLFASVFWALKKQIDGAVLLLVEHTIDRTIMGFEVPASMFTSINPFFILLLSPVFAHLWVSFASRGHAITTRARFLFGLLLSGSAFILFSLAAQEATSGIAASMIWPIAAIFLLTCGELSISPVGVSMISRLAPPHLTGLMIGAWFLSSSFGAYAAGWIGTFVHVPKGQVLDMATYAAVASSVYLKVAMLGFGAALIFLLFMPVLKRLQSPHGLHDA